MAYIDNEADIVTTVAGKVVFESEKAAIAWAKTVMWKLYEAHKTESYRGKLLGVIPYSIKVEKIHPVLEKFLGPNPYA